MLSRTRDLTLTKEGFDPENIHVECRDNAEVDLEVTMKKTTALPKAPN
jgi:hypothetical protein